MDISQSRNELVEGTVKGNYSSVFHILFNLQEQATSLANRSSPAYSSLQHCHKNKRHIGVVLLKIFKRKSLKSLRALETRGGYWPLW